MTNINTSRREMTTTEWKLFDQMRELYYNLEIAVDISTDVDRKSVEKYMSQMHPNFFETPSGSVAYGFVDQCAYNAKDRVGFTTEQITVIPQVIEDLRAEIKEYEAWAEVAGAGHKSKYKKPIPVLKKMITLCEKMFKINPETGEIAKK